MAASFPQYTEQYILDLLNVRITFNKGMNYFLQNRVHDLSWSEDYSSFRSTVSGGYNYSCTLNFKGNNLISHYCNCPAHHKYTGPCKHIVATMLAISSERKRQTNKEKEMAASLHTEPKDAESLNMLGVRYYNGQGVTQSYEEASKYFRKAAEQGLAIAQNNLAWCYENGKGVTQSYAEAVKWYRKAAEQGLAIAQNNLGICYEDGKGVDKSYQMAVEWYRKAADQGNEYSKTALVRCSEYIKAGKNGTAANKPSVVQDKNKQSKEQNNYGSVIFVVFVVLVVFCFIAFAVGWTEVGSSVAVALIVFIVALFIMRNS